MVKMLDRLSDMLCGVIDLAEFVRNVHPDEEWREGANEAYEGLCKFMNRLNTNVGLYEALKSLHSLLPPSTPTKSPQLFAAYAVAIPFLRDFEKSGIHLPTSQRHQFVDLSTSILQLGRKFLQNISEDKIGVKVSYGEIKEGMGESFTRRLFEKRDGLGGDQMTLVDPASWEGRIIARQHPREEVRKRLYVGAIWSKEDHVEVLEELLITRARLARLVGRESAGEVALDDKMAKTTANVMGFLNSLNQHNLPLARADLSILESTKRQHLGLSSFSKSTIQAWDRDFYSDLASRSTSNLPDISAFFSVGTCFQGLSRLFTSLYGIRFEADPIRPGETWSSSVRKLRVIDEDEGRIGTIYCDLFSREGKQQGAAHYTVRCSRRLDDDDAEGDFGKEGEGAVEVEIGGVRIGREELRGLEVEGVRYRGREGVWQEPVIVLVCGFGKEGGEKENGEEMEKDGPTFLQWHEVETLFHEMGHAIHSMIGRTEYHNVSGTRCATDFVELPSILMEHFITSPSVLSLFATHPRTGRTVPSSIIDSLLTSRSQFSALETSTQITMAALDQSYHSSSIPQSAPFDSTALLRETQREFHVIPHAEGTNWQTSFGHLFGYGATYYSYLFDRAIAGRVFGRLFEEDPLSRESGEVLKKKVLRWGGGREPWEMVGEVVGDERVMRGGREAMQEVGRWGIQESRRGK